MVVRNRDIRHSRCEQISGSDALVRYRTELFGHALECAKVSPTDETFSVAMHLQSATTELLDDVVGQDGLPDELGGCARWRES
jgi:hypothetical protein